MEVVDGSQVIEKMERETGFEPATSSLGSWHSTTELLPLAIVLNYLSESEGLTILSTRFCLFGSQNEQHGRVRISPSQARPRSLATHDNLTITERFP